MYGQFVRVRFLGPLVLAGVILAGCGGSPGTTKPLAWGVISESQWGACTRAWDWITEPLARATPEFLGPLASRIVHVHDSSQFKAYVSDLREADKTYMNDLKQADQGAGALTERVDNLGFITLDLKDGGLTADFVRTAHACQEVVRLATSSN